MTSAPTTQLVRETQFGTQNRTSQGGIGNYCYLLESLNHPPLQSLMKYLSFKTFPISVIVTDTALAVTWQNNGFQYPVPQAE